MDGEHARVRTESLEALVMPEREMLLIWTNSSLDGEMGRFYWI